MNQVVKKVGNSRVTIQAFILVLGVLGLLSAFAKSSSVLADTTGGSVGTVVRTITPSPSGNGRAMAFDPISTNLFYTNYRDPHIYRITNNGLSRATLSPVDANNNPIQYGALSWDSTNGVLWGGRYDGSGMVDMVDPNTGAVTPAFSFTFTAGESCYPQPPGFIDGLAFDKGGSLWLSDDASTVLYHVKFDGKVIAKYTFPKGNCNSGIAVDGNSLWLGMLSGPDQPPFSLVRVSKSNPTAILENYDFPDNSGGPEGLAFDNTSFTDSCVLWSNQFGFQTVIQAWKLPASLCQSSSFAPPTSHDAIGVLALTDPSTGAQHSCTASVVNSRNKRVIVTAGHCVTNGSNFFTNFLFAPAHNGPFVGGLSPYGIWTATSADVYIEASYNNNPQDRAYDFAYIVMQDNPAGEKIGDISPSLSIQFNQGRDQAWEAFGYPGHADGSPPFLEACDTGTPGSENADGSVSGDPPYMTLQCDLLTEGASGGPWIPHSSGAVGGVNSQIVTPKIGPIQSGPTYERGTYLGCQADKVFRAAENAKPGAGPATITPNGC